MAAENKSFKQKFWEKLDDCTGWLLACLTDPVPHPLAKVHWMSCFLMIGQAAVTAIITALFSTRFAQAIDFKRKHLFTEPVSPLVPCFMGVAGFGHFLAARSNLFVRITEHRSWSRWAEKALSTGLMYAMVALLCDQEAAVPLLWLIVFNGCSMGVRFVIERDVQHKLYGKGRHSKPHPRPIRSRDIVGRFAHAFEESVALVAKPKLSEAEDDDSDGEKEASPPPPPAAAVPVEEAQVSDLPSRSSYTLPSDWEVITSSIIIDLIALGMFLPYYIDNIKHERWFVHASVAVLIVTIFGYTGLLVLYRRAALKLKTNDDFLKEDIPDDDDDAEKWAKQQPKLVRTKLDAEYEKLETLLIGWSVLTTSALGWLVIIGVVQS